jgi:hypothetical protein
MKEYEATGKFVDISKYEKKMDSDFGFWQKLEMSTWRLLILVYIQNIDHYYDFFCLHLPILK